MLVWGDFHCDGSEVDTVLWWAMRWGKRENEEDEGKNMWSLLTRSK